jgi:hypothetical protein
MRLLKIVNKPSGQWDKQTWAEMSGFLRFLSSVPGEVERFNRSLGFGLCQEPSPPVAVDGDAEAVHSVGFVITRRNPLLPEATYCIYSVLKNGVLHGFTGLFEDGRIRTVRELRPIKDFSNSGMALYDWLRELVRASCSK